MDYNPSLFVESYNVHSGEDSLSMSIEEYAHRKGLLGRFIYVETCSLLLNKDLNK